MLLRGMGVRQVCLIGVNYNGLILPSGAPGDITIGSPQGGRTHQDKPATSRSPRIQDVPMTPSKVMMKKQINSLRPKVCRMAKNIKKLKTRPNTIKGDIEMLSSKLDSLLLTKTAQFVKNQIKLFNMNKKNMAVDLKWQDAGPFNILPPTFPGAPLKVNGASWNIQGNPTGMIMDLYTGIKGLIHYTHNSHACTIEFSCINWLRPSDAYVHWWAGSPLVKAMICCLLAPSHHLFQSRPFSSISIEKLQFWYE